MRVLFVLPYVPSLIRVRPYQLLRELADRHQIAVLATGSERDEMSVAALRSICHSVTVVPVSTGAALRSCAQAIIRGAPLQAAVCRDPRLSRELARLLAVGQFDLVHVEHLRAAHVGTTLPAGLPTVYDSVDSISLLLERTQQQSHSLAQRLLASVELARMRRYEAGALRHFDRTAVSSEDDRQALQTLAPEVDLAVIRNGVDLDSFRPGPAPRPAATLVFSGKMSYHANATAALLLAQQVLPRVQREHPDVRLHIVGSGPPRSVRALARDPAITVTGYVADMQEQLTRATVAVCPVTVKVGIQNKVLEAMATGLPVVSTPRGLDGLLAQPEQEILIGADPAGLATQISRLLAEPPLRERLGRAGRHYVETHHRWSGAAQQFEELYERALKRVRR